MTLSRRSFLKVAGLTVVAAAGASMFTGCSLSTAPVVLVAAEDASDDAKKAVETLNKLDLKVWPSDAKGAYLDSYLKSYLTTVNQTGTALTVVSSEYQTVKEGEQEVKKLFVTVK